MLLYWLCLLLLFVSVRLVVRVYVSLCVSLWDDGLAIVVVVC